VAPSLFLLSRGVGQVRAAVVAVHTPIISGVDRLRAWLVASPLVAAGVLASHAAAYRLTGTQEGTVHSYLAHAPQALLVVALLAIALGGLGARLEAPPAWAFLALAPTAFLAQEHLELLVHAGGHPALASSPAVLVGLLLQLPVSLAVWLLVRRLLPALAAPRSSRRAPGRAFLAHPAAAPETRPAGALRALPLGRGPPALLRP
jgi:hypothetical protein